MKLLDAIKSGIRSAQAEAMGDIDGLARNELTFVSESISDLSISDNIMWHRFSKFCRLHDPKIENQNTLIIFARMLKVRPGIKKILDE